MERMTLEWFVSGPQDLELRQYRVLQALKGYYEQFAHNRLYPYLAELIQLLDGLENLAQKRGDMRRQFPKRFKELDLENNKLIFDQIHAESADFQRTMDLIDWAVPHVKKAIEEGIHIYNFVDEHISIEEVGIMPAYRQEGYWLVPDTRAAQLNLLRYDVSLFSSASERYRALKTVVLESLEEGTVRLPSESVKLLLMKKYQDLPNPATYRCEVDMDFPYSETVLPIGKRKLMAYLVS
jgi:hypothetical protein